MVLYYKKMLYIWKEWDHCLYESTFELEYVSTLTLSIDIIFQTYNFSQDQKKYFVKSLELQKIYFQKKVFGHIA